MTSFRSTLIFGGVVAALVAFAVYDYQRGEAENKKKDEQATLVRFTEEALSRIELVAGLDITVLEKKDGHWMITQPVSDLAETTSVLSLIKSLSDDKARETVVEGDGIDLKVYGLDHPSYRLVLTSADGRREEIKIGAVKAYDSNLYAQIDNEKKVLLVTSTWSDHLSKPPREYRNKRLYRSEPVKANDGKANDDVDTVEVALSGEAPVSYELVKNEKGGWGLKGVKDPAPLSDDLVAVFIEHVRDLRAVDFIEPDKNASGVMSKHGLTKPWVHVRLKHGHDLRFEIKAAAAKGTEPHVAVESSDLKDIASVLKTTVDPIAKRPEDFFDKKAPFKFPVADVAKITIRVQGKTAEFTKKGETWEGGLHGTPDSAKLNELVTKLAVLEAFKFLPEAATKVAKQEASTQLTAGSSIASTIQLRKASGESVFEMTWGAPVTVKSEVIKELSDLKHPGGLEQTYHRARVSNSNRVIAVSPSAIEGLGIEKLLSPPSEASSPTEKATAAPNAK